MSYFISLINTGRSICMCALSFNDAVCKMDTRKGDLESGSRGGLHYQIVGWVRIERESDLLYSIRPIRPSSSFSPSSFFRREHSLCPRPLPLLVFRRRMSFRNERHGFLSFSTLWSCDKSSSRGSRRAYESGEECFGNQFCRAIHRGEESNAGLSMRTRSDSISRRALSAL